MNQNLTYTTNPRQCTIADSVTVARKSCTCYDMLFESGLRAGIIVFEGFSKSINPSLAATTTCWLLMSMIPKRKAHCERDTGPWRAI